jgi:hypothetical protein
VIGLRRTLLASFRSIMTTWFCSLTFSRTQMKWSDSRVSVCHQQVSTDGCKPKQGDNVVVQTWKEMEAGCTPRLESWRCSLKTMGFEMSMVAA